MDLEAGSVVAQRYRIQHPLGRGGMGEVYAAENIRTGRVVAVKVLRADSKQKASAVERFRREARAAGAINSDHVTQVLDVEDDAEHGIILVFEMLEGESLIERLKRTGPMTFDELWPLVEQVWMGLEAAHKSGVIHRDLKPSNVFLERRPDGQTRVKILDFGISKLPKEVGGVTLTEIGQSLGTFSFMPPEQIGKAKTVDHRADIYSCATLIYQAMSGQLPYAAKNILQMVDLKTKSEPRPLSAVLDGPIDPRLETFLSRSLAREPENRFATASDALDAWRTLKRTGGPVLAGAADPNYFERQSAYAAPNPQTSAPQGRSPATVMLQDPRSASASPMAQAASGFSYQGQGASPGGPQQNKVGFGSTIAIDQAPAALRSGGYPGRGSAQKVSGIPVVNDTTSEGGGDHIATVAMPMRNVGQAFPGLPQLHDDRGQSGTQLMRGAMTPAPGSATQQSQPQQSQGPQSQQRPASLTQSGSQIAPGRAQQAAPQPPESTGGEPADMTTVYRREKNATTADPPASPSRGMSMVIGVIAFALVGFAVAAVVIHYLQTGKMIWQ